MWKFIKKTRMFFIVIIIFLFVIFLFSRGHIYNTDELSYGLTFSKKQAIDLGLDWHGFFNSILNDLQARKIRLSAYWDEVEPEQNKYQWEDLDWQINKATESGASIVLAIGMRLPRWPECHSPSWTKSLNLVKREQRQLLYINKVIERYKNKQAIKVWQVENEPFLSNFGECPKLDKKFLDKEISLVKSLDKRPIMITDSGELSLWLPAARRADIFGTTMYRDTYSKRLKKYIHYPISPGFFRLKKNLVSLFAHPREWIVVELQAEPWGPVPFQNLSQTERDKTMSPSKFDEIIEFSRQAGFKEFYLWGVEWWYWEKETNNNPAMWNKTKKLYSKEGSKI